MKIIRHFFTNIKVSNTNIALFWFFVCSISITNGQALLTDFGTANAYQITYPANLNGVIPQGMEFTFRALNANTGASTLQVNGITATSIVKNFNIPLAANDIKVGHFVKVIYDGTNWQMLSSSANPSTGTIGGGGTVNGIAFFTNNSAITADGTNFSYNNGTYTDLSLGKIKIRSKAIDGDNLAFGANAGNTTMAGTFNVMVGGSSGAVITSGSDNAFLGAGAGSLNTSGSSNSFFGSGAGNANSSGQFNTFIGNDAGSVNTSGTNLVVIGKGANVATNNLNNAIAIGANSNVSGNNMMALGGTGTDAVKVGIGTGTPLNTLDVVGGVRIRNLSSVGTNMVAVNAAGDLQIASAGSFLTGSGTTGQVPYFASSSALLGSNIFRYDGSNVAINTNPAGSYLFQVLQNTSSFPAIYGENDQLSGVGIWGYSSNASGQAGVRGVAVGTGYGVYGSSSGTGYGVFGANSSTGPGVYGQNTSGGIAGFFDAGGTGVAGFFSGRVGIGIAAPAFSLVSRTSAVATTAETLAQFDVSDGGGSYLQIKNATSVNSTFEPVIEGNLVGSNNSFVIRGVTNNDAAGAPLVQIDSKFTSSALTTKPLFGVSNNGTQYLSIGPTGVTRVNNLSGTGGAVFADASGDLFVSASSGANAWTMSGANIYPSNPLSNLAIGLNTSTLPGLVAGATRYFTLSGSQSYSAGAFPSMEIFGSINTTNLPAGRVDFINNTTPVNTFSNYARIEGRTGNSVVGHGQIVFYTNNGTLSEKMRLTEAGRLGIGVINPSSNQAQLQVSDLANTSGQIRLWAGTATGETGTDGLLISSAASGVSFQNYEATTPMQFGTGGSTIQMTLSPAGNFGLKTGVSNPTSRFAVDGNATIGTSYYNILAPTNGMIVEGNVGIGTNNPQNKLDVFGNMAVGTYAGLNAAPANSLIVSGRIGIGTAAPQAALEFGPANGSIAFAPSGTGGVLRQIIAANQAANTFAGDPVLIGAGNGGTAGAGNVGGNISISGGNAAGTNPNNGGNIVLTPGNRTGTGLQGVVILKDGHLQSTQTTAPVAVVSIPGAGTGATCTLSNATDIAGRVNLTTGTAAWAAGTQCRITFNRAFSVPPIIILTPVNAIAAQNLGGRQIFASTSNTFFDISFGAAAVSAVAYQFNYVIIETQ